MAKNRIRTSSSRPSLQFMNMLIGSMTKSAEEGREVLAEEGQPDAEQVVGAGQHDLEQPAGMLQLVERGRQAQQVLGNRPAIAARRRWAIRSACSDTTMLATMPPMPTRAQRPRSPCSRRRIRQRPRGCPLHMLGEQEAKIKEMIWANHNKDFCAPVSAKDFRVQDGRQRSRKRRRNRTKKPRIGEGQASPAGSAEEAAVNMLRARSITTKLDYSRLGHVAISSKRGPGDTYGGTNSAGNGNLPSADASEAGSDVGQWSPEPPATGRLFALGSAPRNSLGQALLLLPPRSTRTRRRVTLTTTRTTPSRTRTITTRIHLWVTTAIPLQEKTMEYDDDDDETWATREDEMEGSIIPTEEVHGCSNGKRKHGLWSATQRGSDGSYDFQELADGVY